MSHDEYTRYVCKITNASGLVNLEGQTNDRDEADDYCRVAIEDHCRAALVMLTSGSVTVSWWNDTEVKLYRAKHGRP